MSPPTANPGQQLCGGRTGTGGERAAGGFRFDPLSSAELDRADFRCEYLIDGILVRDQPAVLGGPKKALKTSLAVDMAVSLATATPFLGAFPVPRPLRVAVLSGESGMATLRDTARRVCAARGVELRDADVCWLPRLPRLSSAAQRRDLSRGLAAAGVEFVIIDPLYLCLLARGSGASAANLYEIGPLLYAVADGCLGAGATPLLVHHAVKRAGVRGDGPLGLDDLAFTGIGEFARQWLLVSRRGDYQPGSGEHALTLAAGGSAGHSGCWRVDVSEGSPGPGLTGRRWDVRVSTVDDQPRRGPARDGFARTASPARVAAGRSVGSNGTGTTLGAVADGVEGR